MRNFNFIIKSLRYFSKQHLALFLAVLITTAVLTGALIVGDSVRLSLKKNVDQRLGKVGMVMDAGDRFVNNNLAIKIANDLQIKTAALLSIRGMAIHSSEQKRHNNIQVLGVDSNFWSFSDTSFHMNYGEVILGFALANELDLEIGDRVLLRFRKQSVIPLNAPFTSDEDPSLSLRLKVVGIANNGQLGGFSLKNEQAIAYNAFVNQDQLSDRLDLKGRCNLIVAEKADKINLDHAIAGNWKLSDASLVIEESKNSEQWILGSERVFLENSIVKVCDSLQAKSTKVLTYFVNELSNKKKQTPYSFVSGLPVKNLSRDECLINQWLAQDLDLETGDSLHMKYFIMGPLRKLQERSHTFIVKEIHHNNRGPFSKDLMPNFPGLSSAGNCSDWDAGIPIDFQKIREKDEEYWDIYKGTPKAIIPISQAIELWDNPFGSYTSIRFSTQISKENLSAEILNQLKPIDLGLQFIDMKEKGKSAASNGVDFGELFLSLSFFVMASALLLLILVLRLQLESRISETGILISLGISRKKILWLKWAEIFPIVIGGAIVGAICGIGYNLILINGLNSIWNQAVHTNILEAFVLPKTLLTGFLTSIILSGILIWMTIRGQLKKVIIAVIRDQDLNIKRSRKLLFWVGLLMLILAIVLSAYAIVSSVEKNASIILSAGFLFMLGMVFILRWKWQLKNKVSGQFYKLTHLSTQNIKKNVSRSIAVVVLLALGTFTVIITGANRKTFNETENIRQSGTGGFLFWSETSIPLLYDLNSQEGKFEQGLDGQQALDSCLFLQFKSKTGDDASCLNLNQVQQPQILGVNANILDSLNAFSFSKLLNERNDPWLSLNKQKGDYIIPAIADQTVIQWGLIKKLGDTLQYFNEEGNVLKLVLVGGLNASIFQGNILISDKHFQKHFPSAAGSSFMLIDGPIRQKEAIKQLLTNDLSDYGIELTQTSTRLAQFYSVTNTYLSIFMILGGLGVIIGTIGLGIILLRNMMDRKKELVLYKSLGFTHRQILKVIIYENLVLVLWAMMIGIVSAIIGILPSLLSDAFAISGNFLIGIIVLIFLSALLWIYVSSRIVLSRI